MARPKIILTPEQIKSIASMSGLGLTMDEIAQVLEISKDTLKRRTKKGAGQEGAIEAMERGRATARLNMAKRCYELAHKGNPGLIIFWLKVRAGWKEPTDPVEHSGKIEVVVTDYRDEKVE